MGPTWLRGKGQALQEQGQPNKAVMGARKVMSILMIYGARARGHLMKWWAASSGEAQGSPFPHATFSSGWSSLLPDFTEAETRMGPKGAGQIHVGRIHSCSMPRPDHSGSFGPKQVNWPWEGKNHEEAQKSPVQALGGRARGWGAVAAPPGRSWFAPVEMQWAVPLLRNPRELYFWCFQLKYQMGKEGADAKARAPSGRPLSQRGTDVV